MTGILGLSPLVAWLILILFSTPSLNIVRALSCTVKILYGTETRVTGLLEEAVHDFISLRCEDSTQWLIQVD